MVKRDCFQAPCHPIGNHSTDFRHIDCDRELYLTVLFYHELRRDELCKLMVKDVHERRGVKHLRVHGKGAKLRYVPLHPASQERIEDYLTAAGHGDVPSAPVFKPIRNNRRGTTDTALTTDGVYQLIKHYAISTTGSDCVRRR
jgi:integrase